MKKLLKKILLIGSIAIMAVASSVRVADAVEQYTNLQSFYRATLTTTISSSATTINVSIAPYVDTAYFVIEPRTPNQEIVRMTSRAGTVLTVTRGLSATSSAQTDAGYKRSHAAGSSIELVDVHLYIKELQTSNAFQFRGTATSSAALNNLTGTSTNDLAYVTNDERWYLYNGSAWVKQGDNTETIGGTKTFSSQPQVPTPTASTSASNMGYVDTKVSLNGNESISGIKTFSSSPVVPTPSGNTDAVNKAYADGLAIAGSPIASNTVTGISRIASSTQIARGFSSTTSYAIPSSLASSTASTTGSIVVVTNASTGKIDSSFLATSTPASGFGDGRDGNVTISATTTLTRDMYYNNLTVNSVLIPNGFRIFVKDTLSGTGLIMANGNAGTNAVTTTPGNGGAATTTGYFSNVPGANGGANMANGQNASSTITAIGSIGGAGGSSAGGGTGGTAGATTTDSVFGQIGWLTVSGVDFSTSSSLIRLKSCAGSGGGSGGINNGNTGGAGGGGGACGGFIYFGVKNWQGTFTIQATGGRGGDGGANAGVGAGGSGGGGGAGGTVLAIYGTKTWTGSYSLAGGLGGTGYITGGLNGGNGSPGGTGTAYEIDQANLIR